MLQRIDIEGMREQITGSHEKQIAPSGLRNRRRVQCAGIRFEKILCRIWLAEAWTLELDGGRFWDL